MRRADAPDYCMPLRPRTEAWHATACPTAIERGRGAASRPAHRGAARWPGIAAPSRGVPPMFIRSNSERRRRAQGRPLRFESLEGRALLAGNVTTATLGQTLRITGDAA